MQCDLAAGALQGCSELEQIWTAAPLSLLLLWVVAGAVVWVCPELEAGRDGKTFLETRLGGGAPHHGPENERG